MPRNGSGQYNPLTNTWNPPVTGVLATGADFQAQLNDISAAITQSVSKDGQTPMTANLPMGNNSIVGIASGTETSPSISANGDTNTGLYFPAADTVAIATGGVKRVEVDANGNVGVGVTPSSNWATSGKKVIQLGSGGVLYGDNALAQQVTLGSNWTYDGTTQKYLTTAAAAVYQQNFGGHSWFTAPSGTAGNPITFTQAMTLDASSRLFVGTTSGSAGFNLNSSTASWFNMTASATGASYGAFYKGGTTTLVGLIGTDGGGILGGGTGDNFGIRAESALLFMAGGTERARIDSSGNLLVGISSGTGHNFWKSAPSSYTAWFYNTGTTAGTRVLDLTMSTNGDATGRFIDCGDAGAFRMRVLGNGNLQNFNNSYGAISDAKLKENITDVTPKLEKINQVRIVNFNIIGDTQKQIGVIAQELEQVFPSMIEEMPDRDDEGKDLGTVTKSVKYSVFVPILIKAIQEQQALIEAQKTAIESLTARISALEAK